MYPQQQPPQQQPSPYAPPPVDFSQYMPYGQPDLLGPARRAGALMMVLGALLAMFGACNGGSALVRSPESIAQEQQKMQAAGMLEAGMTPETMKTAAAVAGGLTLLVGIAFLVNGVYVRRASGAAITVGIVLAGGLTALTGMFLFVCVVMALRAPLMLGLACVFAVPFGLLAWLDVWLIQAIRSNAQVNALRTQYQAQFAGYSQQYPGYAPNPYGYAYPPQPPGYGYPAPAAQQTPGTSGWPTTMPQPPATPTTSAGPMTGQWPAQNPTSEPQQQRPPQAERPSEGGGSDGPPAQL
jgi:hypothetical protein